jgi:ribosomal protein S12 methylthiotransferase
LEVILDGPSEEKDYAYLGRTEGDAPEVDNRVLIRGTEGVEPGVFRRVLITDAREYDLEAELQG